MGNINAFLVSAVIIGLCCALFLLVNHRNHRAKELTSSFDAPLISPRFKHNTSSINQPPKCPNGSDAMPVQLIGFNMLKQVSTSDSNRKFFNDFMSCKNYSKEMAEYIKAEGYYIQLINEHPAISFDINIPSFECFQSTFFAELFEELKLFSDEFQNSIPKVHIVNIPVEQIYNFFNFLKLIGSFLNEMIEESGASSSKWNWYKAKCVLDSRCRIRISFSEESQYQAIFIFSKYSSAQQFLSPSKATFHEASFETEVRDYSAFSTKFNNLFYLLQIISINYRKNIWTMARDEKDIIRERINTTISNFHTDIDFIMRQVDDYDDCIDSVYPQLTYNGRLLFFTLADTCYRNSYELQKYSRRIRIEASIMATAMYDFFNIPRADATVVVEKYSDMYLKTSMLGTELSTDTFARYSDNDFPYQFLTLLLAHKDYVDSEIVGSDNIATAEKLEFERLYDEIKRLYRFGLMIKNKNEE